MKQCPRCNQIFNDENSFCLEDGTTLEIFHLPSAEKDTSNPVLSSFPTQTALQKNTNKYFYWIIGIMAIAIIALSLTIYAVIFLDSTPAPNKEKTANNAVSNASETLNKTVASSSENNEIVQTPISVEAARTLLTRWENAQDEQNFVNYQTCYGQPFLGIKKTRSGSVSNLNYGQWINDRRQMLKNAVGLNVEIKNQRIIIEGDTAIVEFDQYYRSVKYSDWGPKILKIKMFPDGAKIVYEELKASYPLN